MSKLKGFLEKDADRADQEEISYGQWQQEDKYRQTLNIQQAWRLDKARAKLLGTLQHNHPSLAPKKVPAMTKSDLFRELHITAADFTTEQIKELIRATALIKWPPPAPTALIVEPKKPTFRLRVEGTTMINTMGIDRCGLDPFDKRMLSLRYEVTIETTALDRHGFVLENSQVTSYFNSLRDVRGSCETLANHVCELLYNMVTADIPKKDCKSISVRLFGGPHASVECHKEF